MAHIIDQSKSQQGNVIGQSGSNSKSSDKDISMEQSKSCDVNFKSPIGFGKSPRNKPTRRSLSGAPLTTYLFETKFQHFKAFHSKQKETKGLNFLLAPPSAAIYRSSLPVTPIATPLFNRNLKFTEQSLHERMRMRLGSPNKRLFSDIAEPDLIEEQESQMSGKSNSTNVSDEDRMTDKKTNKDNIIAVNSTKLKNNDDETPVSSTSKQPSTATSERYTRHDTVKHSL